MKHIIIGNGNLGVDIGISLIANRQLSDEDIVFINSRSGFDPLRDIPRLCKEDIECVWLAQGGMSVGDCKRDYDKAYQTFVHMPSLWLMNAPPQVKLVFFSSDYAYEPNLSKYAELKATMDIMVADTNRGNTALIQVCSLYGEHYPERSFPGRIINACINQKEISLPMNKTTPTPTDFVAENLVRQFPKLFDDQQTLKLNMAPKGSISSYGWGQLILQDFRKVVPKDYDEERPKISHLDNSECPYTWHHLWNQRSHWFDGLKAQLNKNESLNN